MNEKGQLVNKLWNGEEKKFEVLYYLGKGTKIIIKINVIKDGLYNYNKKTSFLQEP